MNEERIHQIAEHIADRYVRDLSAEKVDAKRFAKYYCDVYLIARSVVAEQINVTDAEEKTSELENETSLDTDNLFSR